MLFIVLRPHEKNDGEGWAGLLSANVLLRKRGIDIILSLYCSTAHRSMFILPQSITVKCACFLPCLAAFNIVFRGL